jgi:hypothetical protein
MRSGIAALILPVAALWVLPVMPAAAQAWMVGTWFGHEPDRPNIMYIDRMRPDGTWRGEYRTCDRGKPTDQSKTGRWSMKGDLLVLEVETIDGKRGPYTDPYRMLDHSSKTQKYVSVGSVGVFTPQRVADDFRMPSCELVS